MEYDSEVLFEYALQFRNAIEQCCSDEGCFNEYPFFRRFPTGCCGDASDLLGQFFLEKGFRMWYVSGTHYPVSGTPEENFYGKQTHAWLTTANPLENDDYTIIDITGDQFKHDPEYNYFDIKAYVGPSNIFHDLFEIRDCYIYGGFCTMGKAAQRMQALYNCIQEYIISYS